MLRRLSLGAGRAAAVPRTPVSGQRRRATTQEARLDAFTNDVHAADLSHSLTGGNPLTALLAAFGVSMFALTFTYNLGVPVSEAYAAAAADGDDDGGDEDGKE